MVHKGPIQLPASVKARCMALINIGRLAQVIHSDEDAIRANIVYARLIFGSLLLHDIQDLQRLIDGIVNSGLANESLISDMSELSMVLKLFIDAASVPTRACGIWSMVQY